MTMDLGHEFSLSEPFHWEYPIAPPAQESIALYGSDEDRIRLAEHFSVSVDSLEVMSTLPSAEVRLAVAYSPVTSVEALARLAADRSRAVRVAAIAGINQLPWQERAAARAIVESPIHRLRSRLSA